MFERTHKSDVVRCSTQPQEFMLSCSFFRNTALRSRIPVKMWHTIIKIHTVRAASNVADNLRVAFRNVAQPVVIITGSRHSDRLDDHFSRGITVSSLTSLSLDPPRVVFNVKMPSRAFEVMEAEFVVHMLKFTEAHIVLARMFARNDENLPSQGDQDLWQQQSEKLHRPTANPFTTRLRCTTERIITIGDHCLIVGLVADVQLVSGADKSLLYADGRFVEASSE